MKSNQKSLLSMSGLFIMAAVFLLGACRKDPQEVIALISDSEAAEIIEDAVSDRTAGLTMPAVDATQILEVYINSCNEPGDTTITRSNSNALASYNYVFGMDWLVTCSGLGVPQTAEFNIDGNGNFNSPHWTGTDNAAGSLLFTGLSPQETSYVVSGSYALKGNLTGTLRRISPDITCTVVFDLDSLSIDKNTYQITGGNGQVEVQAASANGQSATVNGTIVFNGNGSATVTVNGHQHTFSWQ